MSDFNITLFEACELLNRSKKSISRYIRRGLLHPEKVKSQQGTLEYRFSKADIEAFKAQEAERADETNTKAENVFETIKLIREAIKADTTCWLFIGKKLNELNKDKGWTGYADHIHNMNDFIKDMGFGVSTARNYMRVEELFGELCKKLEKPPYTRLVELSHIADKISGQEEMWVIKALNLSPQDFEDEIREVKGKQTKGECAHKEQETYGRCTKCGKFLKR